MTLKRMDRIKNLFTQVLVREANPELDKLSRLERIKNIVTADLQSDNPEDDDITSLLSKETLNDVPEDDTEIDEDTDEEVDAYWALGLEDDEKDEDEKIITARAEKIRELTKILNALLEKREVRVQYPLKDAEQENERLDKITVLKFKQDKLIKKIRAIEAISVTDDDRKNLLELNKQIETLKVLIESFATDNTNVARIKQIDDAIARLAAENEKHTADVNAAERNVLDLQRKLKNSESLPKEVKLNLESELSKAQLLARQLRTDYESKDGKLIKKDPKSGSGSFNANQQEIASLLKEKNSLENPAKLVYYKQQLKEKEDAKKRIEQGKSLSEKENNQLSLLKSELDDSFKQTDALTKSHTYTKEGRPLTDPEVKKVVNDLIELGAEPYMIQKIKDNEDHQKLLSDYAKFRSGFSPSVSDNLSKPTLQRLKDIEENKIPVSKKEKEKEIEKLTEEQALDLLEQTTQQVEYTEELKVDSKDKKSKSKGKKKLVAPVETKYVTDDVVKMKKEYDEVIKGYTEETISFDDAINELYLIKNEKEELKLDELYDSKQLSYSEHEKAILKLRKNQYGLLKGILENIKPVSQLDKLKFDYKKTPEIEFRAAFMNKYLETAAAPAGDLSPEAFKQYYLMWQKSNSDKDIFRTFLKSFLERELKAIVKKKSNDPKDLLTAEKEAEDMVNNKMDVFFLALKTATEDFNVEFPIQNRKEEIEKEEKETLELGEKPVQTAEKRAEKNPRAVYSMPGVKISETVEADGSVVSNFAPSDKADIVCPNGHNVEPFEFDRNLKANVPTKECPYCKRDIAKLKEQHKSGEINNQRYERLLGELEEAANLSPDRFKDQINDLLLKEILTQLGDLKKAKTDKENNPKKVQLTMNKFVELAKSLPALPYTEITQDKFSFVTPAAWMEVLKLKAKIQSLQPEIWWKRKEIRAHGPGYITERNKALRPEMMLSGGGIPKGESQKNRILTIQNNMNVECDEKGKPKYHTDPATGGKFTVPLKEKIVKTTKELTRELGWNEEDLKQHFDEEKAILLFVKNQATLEETLNVLTSSAMSTGATEEEAKERILNKAKERILIAQYRFEQIDVKDAFKGFMDLGYSAEVAKEKIEKITQKNIIPQPSKAFEPVIAGKRTIIDDSERQAKTGQPRFNVSSRIMKRKVEDPYHPLSLWRTTDFAYAIEDRKNHVDNVLKPLAMAHKSLLRLLKSIDDLKAVNQKEYKIKKSLDIKDEDLKTAFDALGAHFKEFPAHYYEFKKAYGKGDAGGVNELIQKVDSRIDRYRKLLKENYDAKLSNEEIAYAKSLRYAVRYFNYIDHAKNFKPEKAEILSKIKKAIIAYSAASDKIGGQKSIELIVPQQILKQMEFDTKTFSSIITDVQLDEQKNVMDDLAVQVEKAKTTIETNNSENMDEANLLAKLEGKHQQEAKQKLEDKLEERKTRESEMKRLEASRKERIVSLAIACIN